MRTRPGWAPGPGDPGNSAGKTFYDEHRVKVNASADLPDFHFLWSQYQVKAFMDAMAEKSPGWCVTLNEENTIKMKRTSENPQEAPPVPPPVRIHNHFEGNACLTSKAGLRETMMAYYTSHGRDPFAALPLTFVMRNSSDPEFALWQRAFGEIGDAKGQRLWLLKPGQNANRGNGIKVCDSEEEVRKHLDSKERLFVVQKYMELPMLVHKRKFDIRAYCLVTQDPADGALRAYWYPGAYLRTTSVEYSTKTKDKMVHLNNDAVQKTGEDYGKFESANKLSLTEFQKYLDENHAKDGLSVQGMLVPQMRSLVADAIKAAAQKLNPRNLEHCFEVFGFDFMVDAGFRAWVIEVNTNPCLELCTSYMSSLIPKMLDEAFQLSLDVIFPQGAAPPRASSRRGDEGVSNSWELIYCSTAPDAKELSCSWLPEMPGEGSKADLANMGRDLLTPRPLRSAKSREKRRTPSKGLGIPAAVPSGAPKAAE